MFVFLIADREADVKRLRTGLGDGCFKNTCWLNGVFANLERMLGHELGRSICMFHHAELPFAALFEFYHGKSRSPSTFDGPIGKAVKGEHRKLPSVDFEPIDNPELLGLIQNIKPEVFNEFNKDLQYLIKMTQFPLFCV